MEDPHDDWPSRVLALLANRLTRPSSELALAACLETDYVCDRLRWRYTSDHGLITEENVSQL